MERATGFEPATSTLARWRATNCAKPANARSNTRHISSSLQASSENSLGSIPWGLTFCHQGLPPPLPPGSDPLSRPDAPRHEKGHPIARVPGLSGGEARIRTGGKGFAGPCLTTWPLRHMKKADSHRPGNAWSGLRGSNPRPPPWQGGALPTALSPRSAGNTIREARPTCKREFKKLFGRSLPHAPVVSYTPQSYREPHDWGAHDRRQTTIACRAVGARRSKRDLP